MAEFSWSSGLVGGILIGLSATLLLLANGRIAGISGIFNGAIFAQTGDALWRWLFIGGLLLGTLIYENVLATTPTPQGTFAPVSMIIGGLIVGFGTRMGNGCTSGHGVCGLRPVVATLAGCRDYVPGYGLFHRLRCAPRAHVLVWQTLQKGSNRVQGYFTLHPSLFHL